MTKKRLIIRLILFILVSSRLFNFDDWWSPVISEIINETENSVSYIINESSRHTVTFYFNSNGNYYKAVQYFKPSNADLTSFLQFNSGWFGEKGLFRSTLPLQEYYKGTHSYVLKWKCDNYDSGFAHYTYQFQGLPDFTPAFRSININSMSWETPPFAEYPELEISFVMEFEGMIIEHHLRPDPDDPSQFLREAVYTSTFLTGD